MTWTQALGWLVFIGVLALAMWPFLTPRAPRRYEDFPSTQWFYDGGKDS